ncbi:hypothetical protein, partial [Symbiobacterium thermophilum]
MNGASSGQSPAAGAVARSSTPRPAPPANDDGEVMTNLGGFGGLVYEGPDGKDVRERVAAIWWDELPESFRR